MLTDPEREKTVPKTANAERDKGVRILAKSIYRELKAQGYDQRQIVRLATDLLSEVTDSIAKGEGAEK